MALISGINANKINAMIKACHFPLRLIIDAPKYA